MKKLLIVESPTKARTISRMLDGEYTTLASMGHIRDLPEHSFGVDIANGFTPQYVDTPRSAKIVRELLKAAKASDEIYLAPDPDREGEAIAWHLSEVLKSIRNKPFYRVSFHEITRSAIERSLKEKGVVNLDLVNAQQARRVLDRIVGYQVSPLLWQFLEKGISAGRVQSVAVRLIVERERAINAFQPEEYWCFSLLCRTPDGREFVCRLFKINGADFRIADEAGAAAVLQAVMAGSTPEVAAILRSERKRNAPPPFTTSTLQQAASTRFHFSATDTMHYAQQLYEGVEQAGAAGLITYMRTDSVNIAKEAQVAARDFIERAYGRDYVPPKFNVYRSKASAQEAHEAIRPTDVTRTPESLASALEPRLLKLYTLIWNRFVASQMKPALQHQTAVDVVVRGTDGRAYDFRATAVNTVFPGFTRVYSGDEQKSEDNADAAVLSALAEGQKLEASKFDREQKFTEPPPRYTEASLIRELEENGIGRPSTYATILRTIQQRHYVVRKQGKLYPSELGERVVDFLVGQLPELFNVGFTAGMEEKLDKIEEGKLGWTQMLTDFYRQFEPWVERAKHNDMPPADNARELMEALGRITFAPARRIGRRTYDDAKFFQSVQAKFKKDGAITAKQYQALLTIAARYADQLKAAALPEAVAQGIAEAGKSAEARESRTVSATDEQKQLYQRIFDDFKNVRWEKPVTRRGRVYDDAKFFKSVRDQALAGRTLSEKQREALAKLAAKYRTSLNEPDFVTGQLDAAPAPAPADADETAALLRQLRAVKAWAEPVKRGRITYNDKSFYESLAKQFAEGRQFSEKQIAALRKLAAKYAAKDNAEA